MSRNDKEPFLVKFLKSSDNSECFFKALESIKEFQSEEYLQIITEEEALKIQENDRSLYICDPFSGVVFDHLKKLGCRIVGPQVVIFCMHHQRCVPRAEHPVYNMVMSDVTISCTSLEKDKREEVHKYVQMMGGRVYRDLNISVTHLIAGEVGSKKYLVAANLKKPILLPSWIKTLWEKSQEKKISRYTDVNMEDFKCPIFLGCIICVTGLCSLDRKAVQQLTVKHGGQYMGQLKMNECTHLIVQEPKGQKYECAKRWNVHCVTTQWFFDSVDKGFCQDESIYKTEPRPETKTMPDTSTPTGQIHTVDSRTLSDVSHISNINASCINESMCNSVLNSKVEPTLENLENLDVSAFQAPEDLLDGCRIYLCGFSGRRLDKLRRLINSGGGVRFNQLNEDVTHVIVGDYDDELKQFWDKSAHRPHVVGAKWLLECFSKGYMLPEETYIHANYQPVEIPVSDQPENKTALLKKNNSFSKKDFASDEKHEQADEDLLSQYVNNNPTVGEAVKSEVEPFNDSTHISPQKENQSSATHCLPDASTTTEEGLFSQKSFLVLGFSNENESNIANIIRENAGKVVSLQSRIVADYAVVPLLGCEVEATVGEVVTNTWLVTCIDYQTLIDPKSNPLFMPVPFMAGMTPLEDCVISFSQCAGAEKDSLTFLANRLGASVQEFFVRKSNAKKGMFASTHLVLKEPGGSKYEAAKKWNLPAVTISWLLETARMGKRANENHFLIEKSTKEEQSLETEITNKVNLNPDTPEHPVAHLETQRKTAVTPLDMNRFQSRAFHAVISQHTKQVSTSSPVGQPLQKEPSLHLDTPSKFLSKDKLFKPSFDVKDEAPKPLHKVVVCVSKKLSKKQSELNGIAASLGADYRWSFDETVTHFIYQGRPNDTNREYKSVKERGVHIVSEHWLLECAQEYKHLPESLYPHTYNPKMSLDISTVQDGRISNSRLLSADSTTKDDEPDHLPGEENDIDNMTTSNKESATSNGDGRNDSKGALTQTLEMRENFQKQLQEIMSATSIVKPQGPRASLSRSGCNSASSTPDSTRSARSGRSRVLEALRQSRQTVPDINTEPSQNEQIIWDDPTAREERARLASNLQWPSCPTQYSELQVDIKKLEDSPFQEPLHDPEIAEQAVCDPGNVCVTEAPKHPTSEELETPVKDSHLIPTPQAPSIAFPLANPPVAPHPREKIITIEETHEDLKKQYIFQLSSLNPQERIDYCHLIEKLGGLVIEKQCFDPNCTHIVVGHPLRNEKYLASVAAGKWVLHRSYLEACRTAGHFVLEEDYEWGSSSILDVLTGINVQQRRLALAAMRWRKKIQQRQESGIVEGAFSGWKVILHVDQSREAGFKRLLQSGGAKVLPGHSVPLFKEATHLFSDFNKLKPDDSGVNIAEAAAQNVYCLKTEYIADYLMQESPPPVENYCLPEAVSFLQNNKEPGPGLSQKRKAPTEKNKIKRPRVN
ncbi:DNA topoisomerase 2-binding protein 1 isoform X4 [Canis lupus baileyi]|uniref:DNA topoisomerase 2-binding protein 1 isoform X4 n=1 Tax=Canis lupus familiaris TaxID=9615 RepID=UPI000BAA2714|nr:DNA topoisomerase 2-binding protein 1 isoform X4 [Canis lupus familiaris]XP_025304628.1 DNA topoisomerase 2-binding protein 1 isoform X4 [Canis lupus dingo]XP_038288307.1 DNA topoisomerase 2-binding protein 1 isoform X4 [Canis lupus familiaris]XP_038426846.1 DNA topoisomerase 2-binding protein 1 isoform X4 [Canis lupus familiaris]|eukprot:XP_022264362.1 DNA topoisomerase 2-binding protein 1 isoform X4 [Canis lupus familiaris]